jgi:biopolymer transport protein ExbB/TolQ
LDPATFSGAGTDLDTFLNGIHVAMIATFIGLLLRLLALEAARVNLLLLRRAFVLLSANNVKVGDAAPKSSERGSCK